MGLFIKVSPKELLEIKNQIFFKNGIQALYKNKFQKSPFSTAWFGKNNLHDYSYELCRLTTESQLEIIIVHISKGDNWIKIYLNIFELNPELKSIDQLTGVDGLQFHLPPNSLSQMRLRSDDSKGIPLFSMLFGKAHKLSHFYSKNGLNKEIKELSKLVTNDMTNIDYFIKRWHEKYQTKKTTWEGHQIS